jgi:uncharacterized protein YdeI (YjbR/CyaY-like superfamily)
MKPTFFATPEKFRAWLAANHTTAPELLVGFYKRGSGKPSITWPESVDEALCYGWIDGVRRSLGESAYSIRFTPRRQTGVWSLINVGRVEALIADGRMQAAGLRAFRARSAAKTGIYSFERTEAAALSEKQERKLRANAKATRFFESQPPWYRRAALHWIVSAKREETRESRLAQLIADSAAGRTVPPLTRPQGRGRSKSSNSKPPKGRETAVAASKKAPATKSPARTRGK